MTDKPAAMLIDGKPVPSPLSDLLEPGSVEHDPKEYAQLSIAISLKRIADIVVAIDPPDDVILGDRDATRRIALEKAERACGDLTAPARQGEYSQGWIACREKCRAAILALIETSS